MLPGMRTRSPKSLLAGMMWFDPQRPDALNNIRHNAQERDGMCLDWHHYCAYNESLHDQ